MYPNLYRYSLGKLIEKFKIQTRTGHEVKRYNDVNGFIYLYVRGSIIEIQKMKITIYKIRN